MPRAQKESARCQVRIIKILLTGPPKSGKTTLVCQVAELLTKPYVGFYTEEILDKGKRAGFALRTFSGKKGILAHVRLNSKDRVGKYKVDISDLEQLALPEISEGLKEKKIILIDEIGKMELFSEEFKEVVWEVLDSDSPFLGTIIYTSHCWADRIKGRKDVELIEVTETNGNELVARVAYKLMYTAPHSGQPGSC